MAAALVPALVVAAAGLWSTIVVLIWRHTPRQVRLSLSSPFFGPAVAIPVPYVGQGSNLTVGLGMAVGMALLLLICTVGRPELIIDPEYIYDEDPIPDGVIDRSRRTQLIFLGALIVLVIAVEIAIWPSLDA